MADARRATRWREYLFLVAVVGLAIAYGTVNDLITSQISWEYFYYGKDLAQKLGPLTPPERAGLARAAALVGVKATWSAGLIVGVALLFANNPKPSLPQCSYPRLLRACLIVLVCCILAAAILGAAGYLGCLTKLSSDFREMVRNDEFHPHRFMAVFGIHLGGYFGGAVGTVLAAVSIRRNRRGLPHEIPP